MSASLQRKSVLITGCTPGGIGFELAKEYQLQGLHVFATARRADVCAELNSLGFEGLELDVTNDESVRACRERLSALTGGSLDVLVSAADPARSQRWMYPCPTRTKYSRSTSLASCAWYKRFVPLLIASGDGRIVNVGSIAGVMPYPFGAVYNASKAALHAYGDTLRLELAPFNIQVLTIATGGIKSNISHTTPPIQPNSLYAPIAEHFAKYRRARSQKSATPSQAYASAVVAQSLRKHVKAWFWTGSFSYWCWFVNTFLWRTAFDWPFSREFGLTALKKILATKKHA
ncbi:Arabinanase/levansucrase/invertase superfamily protein [Mycena chlorophos]|uniref:Arabinanase/levansucrase/invertase superfamily protein n=1 Tax=Mycena chlorophos TaxID=658473 RepID=A0A8H6WNB9_MYCCL|nr:Arabinanase/levansucrase/invertase superfamily protein [Mycena chlorophos]